MTGQRGVCRWCGGLVVEGSTCPKSIDCPVCHAAPGSACVRPSGHRADMMHAPRIGLAEGMDEGRQIRGQLAIEVTS